MKRLLSTLCITLLTSLVFAPTPAQAQAGQLLKTFDLQASRLLLDPARPRIYALLPGSNSVAVIDTNTNSVTTTLPVGSDPVDMAISPDGGRLYVANSGSTTAGVGVVDLTSLAVLPSVPSPFTPSAIAAGAGNRLYLLSAGVSTLDTLGIAQVDATTGTLQNTFGQQVATSVGYLKTSPDGNTLYYAGRNVSPGILASYDISTATANFLERTSVNYEGGNGEGLVVSPRGDYLLYPNGGGNDGHYATALIPADNVDGVVGSFANGAFPGVATFKADESEVYQVQTYIYQTSLQIFSTTSFDQVTSFPLPPQVAGAEYFAGTVTSIAATQPNGYLYVAATTGSLYDSPADLILVSTQTAPFFNGSVPLADDFFYLQFPDDNLFGYYNFDSAPYLYHSDLGFEYPLDAADDNGGIYLYDFKSSTFFYTTSTLFPYLYDFALGSFLYYYPNTKNPGHYTSHPRYFYNFATGKIITL